MLQKTPSMLEEFHFEEKGPEILAVAFDGSYVWAYFIGQKIRVWTLDGGLVAECDDKNGALPTDGPVRLAALKKGEVLAVGSFAKNQKFWCANLKLNGNSIKSDCFFRAEAPFQNSGRVSDSPIFSGDSCLSRWPNFPILKNPKIAFSSWNETAAESTGSKLIPSRKAWSRTNLNSPHGPMAVNPEGTTFDGPMANPCSRIWMKFDYSPRANRQQCRTDTRHC
ncbi:MAG: hypothetical protein IPK83_23335 [Planctomycetes bacterium]|nr:hypothetical protein [Planctomycetota bacterium]